LTVKEALNVLFIFATSSFYITVSLLPNSMT